MKALIAEDDLYTRQALTTILQDEGWEVVACADGRNAVQNFKTTNFDLVCLDIMMPQLSGYDVCREIRKTDAEVPVLFISAKSEEIDTVLGLELGADDFIVKPFGVRELQARIRAILRRAGAKTGAPEKSAAESGPVGRENTGGTMPVSTTLPAFAFGPWEVRPAERRAWRDGKHVDLNARETAMLALLTRNPGRVITRTEFFRECWDLDEPPLSRTLDQYIARLRKKLEIADGTAQLIWTVQGEGYRYEMV